MCGHTSRTTQGGTIAVLSPPSSPPEEQHNLFEGNLYFQNGNGTKAMYRGKNVDALTGCVVVIQCVLFFFPSTTQAVKYADLVQ